MDVSLKINAEFNIKKLELAVHKCFGISAPLLWNDSSADDPVIRHDEMIIVISDFCYANEGGLYNWGWAIQPRVDF